MRRRRTSGFSLVELMVAITLGLVVMAAVISMFVGSRAAYQSTAAEAAYTDSGRTAIDLIEQDTRNAGYIACTETTYPWWSGTALDSLIDVSALNGAEGTLGYDFRYGVMGYEANGTAPGDSLALAATPAVDTTLGDWSPALDAAFGASVLTPPPTQVYGSDVLVLRSSTQTVPAYTTGGLISPGATSITVNDSTNLQPGQLVAISDCTKAVVFQVSSAASGAVQLGSTGSALPGNVSGASIRVPFDEGSIVTPLTTTVYYIGKGSDGDTALKRLNLTSVNAPVPGQFTDEEVVPDIENMQVLYGVATPGTFTPAQYVTADAVADFRAVVSVKLALLAASPPNAGAGAVAQQPLNVLGTTVTAPNDNRQRRVFEVTIAIRNQMP